MTRQSRKAAAAAIISTTLLTTPVSASPTVTGAILRLPAASTTITAYEVTSTTGLAVINSKTYSLRGPGLTLPNGDVVSVLFDGIGDEKTTQTYGNLVTQQVPNPTVQNSLPTVGLSTITGGASVSESSSSIGSAGGDSTVKVTGGGASAQSATSAASASASSSSVESSNMGAKQQSIGGGKVVALVGALAAVVLCGL